MRNLSNVSDSSKVVSSYLDEMDASASVHQRKLVFGIGDQVLLKADFDVNSTTKMHKFPFLF
jgi:hypothetical protein